MNYIDQVKEVKGLADSLVEEISGAIDESPGDLEWAGEMRRLLGILHVLSGDVSRAIDAIEKANLQHLP